MTDHTPTDTRLDEIAEELSLNYDHRDCPNDCMAAGAYKEAKAQLKALINDAVREARHEERSWTVRNLQSNTPQTMLMLASERLKNIALSKDKEETDEN